MIYHDPATVWSPRDCIDNVQLLYDGGLTDVYSLAIVTWEGQERIGIRWNVNQREWADPAKASNTVRCIGEPNSRGYPTWFIMPEVFLSSLLSGNNKVATVLREALDRIDAAGQ
ncbi:hypothetical protein EWM62_05240 [Mucilaginibacter terrigena]|uniref:Uncharacterized protein n=1 Tax=Mucilaginibacter terrigena TaxID=2492395 RepID=A0A4Q5LPK8_9SPHI|nr:hypothetical protein [Mucilaginibacter terrigena]RYU91346.1 hypothetical protein EWM62_05240 [Mucilaginibacter terrigena]